MQQFNHLKLQNQQKDNKTHKLRATKKVIFSKYFFVRLCVLCISNKIRLFRRFFKFNGLRHVGSYTLVLHEVFALCRQIVGIANKTIVISFDGCVVYDWQSLYECFLQVTVL